MRPMRRQDRAVTAPEKIRAVIDACEVCRLGLQDGRGVYVVPVNFGHTVEGGRHVFYFHGAAEGRKVDLVRRNGWALLCPARRARGGGYRRPAAGGIAGGRRAQRRNELSKAEKKQDKYGEEGNKDRILLCAPRTWRKCCCINAAC